MQNIQYCFFLHQFKGEIFCKYVILEAMETHPDMYFAWFTYLGTHTQWNMQ